jgi:hypothetical protein
MKIQSVCRGSSALLALGIGLMLIPASPAFAGISNFSIDQTAILASDGRSAQVAGTILCPSGEVASITVQVTQIHSQKLSSGSGSVPTFSCTGALQTWIATVTVGTAAPLHLGSASAQASAFAAPISGPGENATTTAEIKLQKK